MKRKRIIPAADNCIVQCRNATATKGILKGVRIVSIREADPHLHFNYIGRTFPDGVEVISSDRKVWVVPRSSL